MIKRLREFFEELYEAKFALECGMPFRFVLANLIMRDELREAVVFARLYAKTSMRFFDVNPELAKKKLKLACDQLDGLFKKDGGEADEQYQGSR